MFRLDNWSGSGNWDVSTPDGDGVLSSSRSGKTAPWSNFLRVLRSPPLVTNTALPLWERGAETRQERKEVTVLGQGSTGRRVSGTVEGRGHGGCPTPSSRGVLVEPRSIPPPRVSYWSRCHPHRLGFQPTPSYPLLTLPSTLGDYLPPEFEFAAESSTLHSCLP